MEDPDVTRANDGNDEPMWLNERKNTKEPKQVTPTTGSDDANRHTHSTDDAHEDPLTSRAVRNRDYVKSKSRLKRFPLSILVTNMLYRNGLRGGAEV